MGGGLNLQSTVYLTAVVTATHSLICALSTRSVITSKMIHASSWGEPEREMQFADFVICHGTQTMHC